MCIYGSGQPYTYACSHKPTLTHTMLNILGLHPGSSKSNSKGDVNMQNAYTRETCEMRTHAKCVHTRNVYTREMRTHVKCVHTPTLLHTHTYTHMHTHTCAEGLQGAASGGAAESAAKGDKHTRFTHMHAHTRTRTHIHTRTRTQVQRDCRVLRVGERQKLQLGVWGGRG